MVSLIFTTRCKDKISLIVEVGGHRVIINNLGKEDFSYLCDDKCAGTGIIETG